MAPKTAAKPKELKVEPSTPKTKPKVERSTPKKTPSTSARKPKTDAPPRNYHTLAVEDGVTSVLKVKYEGSQQAAPLTSGGYSITLKLDAPNAFTVLRSTVLTEGLYEGFEAIIIRPAKPFKFMKLPEVVRNSVYRMYFAPKGLTEVTTPIVLDGKRSTDKVPYSKSFAEGKKNRVALLAVCKEVRVILRHYIALTANGSQVNAEASAMLYSHPLRFESITLLGEFLAEHRSTRTKIFSVEVKTYNKKSARIAFNLLAEAPNLSRLRLEAGVSTDADPRKAAKSFYLEAAQLLQAIGKQNGNKQAGVDILEFAKGSLAIKLGDKAKNYNEDMMQEFEESLKKLCKDTWTPTGWTCWCGNPRGGHICREVMKERQDELQQRETYMQYRMLVQEV